MAVVLASPLWTGARDKARGLAVSEERVCQLVLINVIPVLSIVFSKFFSISDDISIMFQSYNNCWGVRVSIFTPAWVNGIN